MKQSLKLHSVRSFLFFTLLSLVSIISFAQDSTTKTTATSTSTTTTQNWYEQPWVWVVGGVVVLALIIAMVSGGKDRVEKTTVIKTRSVD